MTPFNASYGAGKTGGTLIEITRGKSEYQYRISPTEPRIVERRLNQHGQHWYFWLRRDTANEAKRALLQIQHDDTEPVTP